jgi:putative membrane protein
MLLEQLTTLFDAPLAFTRTALFVPMSQLADYILSTLIFVGIGLVFFALAFFIIVKTTPFSIRKELEEDHNTALAIVIGSVIIGIALIVSAAIHG